GGHSLPRIIHAADATGKAISTALVRALQAHPNVTLLVGHTAIDLLTPAHHSLNRLDIYAPLSCVGAYVLDQATGQVKRCVARLSCSTMTRSGATWPHVMWWRAVFTTRCSAKTCPMSSWICVRTSPNTAFASTFLLSMRSA